MLGFLVIALLAAIDSQLGSSGSTSQVPFLNQTVTPFSLFVSQQQQQSNNQGTGNPSLAQSIPLGTQLFSQTYKNNPVVQVTTGVINPTVLSQISPSPIIQNQAISQGVAIQNQVAIQSAAVGGPQNLTSVTIKAPSGSMKTFL